MWLRRQFRIRAFTIVLLAIAGGLVALWLWAILALSTPRYRGPISDHFDGERFFNPVQAHHRGKGSFFAWMLRHRSGAWFPWLANRPEPPPPERVGKGELLVTNIGHATVLIQMDGVNILTDPVFSEIIGPFSFVGPKRHRPPGIALEALPPIDIVLVSHNHYDHLDRRSLEAIERRDHPAIFTGLGNKAMIPDEGASAIEELEWWETRDLGNGCQLVFVPAVHFSARSPSDRNRSLWGGFMITGPAGSVYFAGDTGMGPPFEEIRRRLGKPSLAILPIGAYKPRWFMAPMHLSPDEALDVAQTMGAMRGMAIHYGTFRLGDDGQFNAVEDLFAAMRERKIPFDRFWVLEPGEGRRVP